ncbi:MAG: arginine--tRNA ligase [Planctomycetes bacterium HGW-Planctomycetes-1]|nr:MAG: arginine--tRNA ligase [Planctomycetes bacterium HGW-Planctomycetes-1]
MKPAIEIISERISGAIQKATGQNVPAIVTAATDAKFGDYQSNNALALAKQLKANPRQLAEKIIAELQIDDICQKPEIAGAGFINLRLKPEFVIENLKKLNSSKEALGIEKAKKSQTVVVDFSGPNIAKAMHVGHLRSTILGDCICRMLEQQGHDVIRQNHIGDWGTQFGMLCCALYEKKAEEETRKGKGAWDYKVLADLEAFYREAQELYNKDEEFRQRARDAVLKLHTGDQMWLSYWEDIVKCSKRHYEEIYRELNVSLTDKDVRGESFYKDKLADVVKELKKLGLAVESDGAICVFPEGFKTKESEPLPFIIQKSDGAFLYATTDLAAIRYRVNELKADEIIYVTDARQKLHFEMLFAVAKMAGWVKDTKLVHITFGSVLGEDGKPLKTRSGENVKLKELLDEAVKRAKSVVEEKNPELKTSEKETIANAVGIGAVKYADYSNNRTSDYIFSFDKMLAMDGNTAPYMQYAYARVKSIGRKGEEKGINTVGELKGIKEIYLNEPAELELAKQLIRYGEAFNSAIADFKPNFLTGYLYELAAKFSAFYNACPVLDAERKIRPSRLLLCELTARTIRHGLENLLGIKTIERM